MASINNYREIVKQLLTEYAQLPTFDSQVKNQTIFDLVQDHYMLLSLGWHQQQRIHYCIIHIDIINNQIWIQANNTDQLIAEELVAAGVPPQSIVLGLQPPEVRPLTDYGIPSSGQKQKGDLGSWAMGNR